MQTLLISAILILFLVVVFQIAKASEYVAVIRGYENARKQSNNSLAFFCQMHLQLAVCVS